MAFYVKEAHITYRRRKIAGDTPPKRFHSSKDVAAYAMALFGDATQEEFWVFALNAQHRIIGTRMVSRGTVDSTMVHPRDVLRYALMENAAAFVVAHNHPSGVSAPSAQDDTVTRRLTAAAEIVGIDMVDHVIVADDGHYSYREAGSM